MLFAHPHFCLTWGASEGIVVPKTLRPPCMVNSECVLHVNQQCMVVLCSTQILLKCLCVQLFKQHLCFNFCSNMSKSCGSSRRGCRLGSIIGPHRSLAGIQESSFRNRSAKHGDQKRMCAASHWEEMHNLRMKMSEGPISSSHMRRYQDLLALLRAQLFMN